MSENTVTIAATPDEVFDVLDDPCAYPRWVVGARRVRAVDPDWPQVGSCFHHAIGTAAAELHDSSKILERRRPERLVLEVRFLPTGVAEVALDVAADGSGSSVTMVETPVRGPITRLPRFVTDPALTLRNAIALWRLRREVERQQAEGPRAHHHDAPSRSTDMQNERDTESTTSDPSAGGRDTATGTDPDAKYEQPGFEDKSFGQAVKQDMDLVDDLLDEEGGDLDRAEERFDNESAGSPTLARQRESRTD